MRPRRTYALVLVAALSACGTTIEMCENSLRERHPAPDGKHEAVVYDRLCTPKTSSSTNVSVLPAGGAIKDVTGNAYVVSGRVNVTVAWESGSAVAVRAPAGTTVRTKSAQVDGVAVRAEP